MSLQFISGWDDDDDETEDDDWSCDMIEELY